MSNTKPRENSSQPGAVKSAVRTLDILELMLEVRGGLSIRGIGERLRIPVSSVHALVHTLVERGYLAREDSLIVIGPRLHQLCARLIGGSALVTAAEPVMEHVNQLCGQTVGLAILEGSDIVIIDQKIGRGPLRVVHELGVPIPAHATATGKAMLALLPHQELARLYPDDLLEKLAPKTITEKTELLRILEEIRRTGVAYNKGEAEDMAYAVGSAIRDHYGRPVAGIGITPLAARGDTVLTARLAALIKAAALVISHRLGYVEPEGLEALDVSMLTRTWERRETIFET